MKFRIYSCFYLISLFMIASQSFGHFALAGSAVDVNYRKLYYLLKSRSNFYQDVQNTFLNERVKEYGKEWSFPGSVLCCCGYYMGREVVKETTGKYLDLQLKPLRKETRELLDLLP